MWLVLGLLAAAAPGERVAASPAGGAPVSPVSPAGRAAARAPASNGAPTEAVSCVPDADLVRAAAELLLTGRFKPAAAELIAAVRAAGSDGVGLHALYVPPDMAEPAAAAAQARWLAEQRQRADAPLRCGSAQSERGRLWIGSSSGGRLGPIAAGEHVVVRGELAPGFQGAELVISNADGQLARYGVSPSDLTHGTALESEDGSQDGSGLCSTSCTVQLVAHGPAGPRPVAERWVRAADDLADAQSPMLTSSAPDSDIGLTALIAELRAARSRPRLRVNSLLSQAATSHARVVCERGQVAHEVRQGEGPEARLADAGLSARVLGEAIARANDAPAAFAALQRSPSHLFTLLDARFTDFAVGVASDRVGKRCYVVMLCAWPRALAR